MHGLYVFSVFVHILAATLWVGGMGFFALVVVPVVRRSGDPAMAQAVLRAAGARFAVVGWICLAVIGVTGVVNLGARGLLPLLATVDFWRSPFGKLLAAKLGLVAVMLLVSLVHGRDAKVQAWTPARRRRATALGRSTLMLSLAVVGLGVFLVRGAPW